MNHAAMLAEIRRVERAVTDPGGFVPRSALARMALLRAERAADTGDVAAFTTALDDAWYYDHLIRTGAAS